MKRFFSKNIMFFLFPALVLFTAQCQFEGTGKHSGGNANRSVAELKGEFAEDSVLVVLKKTDLYKEFSLEDFPEVLELCSKVEELTHGMTALLRKQEEGKWEELQYHIDHAMLMDKENYQRILKFTLAEKSKNNVLDTVQILQKKKDIVLHAEPDFAIEYHAAPDPLPEYWLGHQFDVFDRVSLPQAWGIETGSSAIMIGVIDSGIQVSQTPYPPHEPSPNPPHPALEGRVNFELSRDFSWGHIDGQPGFINYYQGPWGLIDEEPNDGHGTFIGGILAGNGIGITGVCWDITLVSLRFGSKSSDLIGASAEVLRDAFISNAVLATAYAASVGIPILNMSFGVRPDEGLTYYTCQALQWVIMNYPGVVVCSAGNDGNDLENNMQYPASFSLKNLITVGALNVNDDYPANNSNYSNSDYGVDLFAPGAFFSIMNTTNTPNGGYETRGPVTSYAAPMVTGVCALIKSKYSLMRGPEIKALILQNVDEKPELTDKCVTGGMLNAFKALNADLFGGGTGELGDPYEIWNEHHLANIGLAENKHFIMMDGIELFSWPYGIPWKPIPCFSGYLEGNGKTISGLYIYDSAPFNGIGLFGLNTGTINNLHINGHVVVAGEYTYGGVLCGINAGNIESCTVTNYDQYVISNNFYLSSFIGGITGLNDSNGVIHNCAVFGNIYSTSVKGSFAAHNNGYIHPYSNMHFGQLLP